MKYEISRSMGNRRLPQPLSSGTRLPERALSPRSLLAIFFVFCMAISAAAPVLAQSPDVDLSRFNFGGPVGGDKVTVTAEIIPGQDGGPAELAITARIAADWHISSLNQKLGGPTPTAINLDKSDQYRVGDFQATPPPSRNHELEPIWPGLEIWEHKEKVTWIAPIETLDANGLDGLVISGEVTGQACRKVCEQFTVPFEARAAGTAAPAIGQVAVVSAAPPTDNSEASSQTPLFDSPARFVKPEKAETGSLAVAKYIFFALIAGLILNFMPCVLPVIGLKIMSFVTQAGENRRRVLMLNLAYVLGLISVFMILAVCASVLNLGWGDQFKSYWFTISLASVVFVFALSFLGVWEIPIPGFVGSGSAAKVAEKEGYFAAFIKGVLTTVLATPCSGPLLLPTVNWATDKSQLVIYSIFFAMGLGMASPYLIIGAFPNCIKWLPKPGAWMETFKHAMGFVLLGTVIFLMSGMKQYHVLPTVALLFGLWFACWWYGRVPLTAGAQRRWFAFGTAVVMIVCFVFVSFGMLDGVMQQRFDRDATRIADYKFEDYLVETGAPFFVRKQVWQPYTRRKLEWLIENDKPFILDFTADW